LNLKCGLRKIRIRRKVRHKRTNGKKLDVANIVRNIDKYSRQWKAQVEKTKNNRLHTTAIQYRPRRRRNVGRFEGRRPDQE
jgi:hypothetical protein